MLLGSDLQLSACFPNVDLFAVEAADAVHQATLLFIWDFIFRVHQQLPQGDVVADGGFNPVLPHHSLYPLGDPLDVGQGNLSSLLSFRFVGYRFRLGDPFFLIIEL